MKRIIALLCILFVLAGCVGTQPQPPKTQFICADGSVVADKAKCPVDQQVIKREGAIVQQTEEQVKEVTVGADSVTQELVATAQKRAKSIQYYLRFEAGSDLAGDQYFVRASNNRYKIILDEPLRKPSGQYDTIYVDRSTNEGIAGCTEMDSFICTSNKEDSIEVFISNYQTKTPYDWLEEISKNGQYLRDSTVQNRQTKMVSFTAANGKKYTAFMDAHYGIPLRIELDAGGETYFFYEIGYNSVDEEELIP